MARCAVKDLLEFLGDERLSVLLTAVDRGILLYDDLDEYDLPEGLTKDETWGVLETIKRQSAIKFIGEEYADDVDVWFAPTSAVSLNSKALEVRSRVGFPLDNALASLKGSPFLTRNIERTLCRAFETEGIDVDKDRVHELFAGNDVPRTDLDRVIVNYIQLSSECDEFAKRDVTQGLVETIYYRLIEGVDTDAIPRRACTPEIDPRISPESSEACIKSICLRSKTNYLDQLRFGPVLRIINVPWFFWNFDVFPRLNSLVGVLLRNILALKWGYPILSWVPVSYHPHGTIRRESEPAMDSVFKDCFVDHGYGFDFTSFFLAYLEAYRMEIDRLEMSLAQLQRLNSLIEKTFDFPMNNRQKSILSSVCKEPQAPLRIAPHQRTFKIAYATARKDFLDLEKEGLLVREYEGRAFVFRACPELASKIMQLGETAMGSL